MKTSLIFTLIGITFWSCSNDDDNAISSNCDFETLSSAQQYLDAPSAQLNINSLEINDDCLKINFSSSGCSGDTWEFKLIDSEAIFYSNPPSRDLRLSLNNEEICEAYITKEFTFDISNLQLSTENTVLLAFGAGKSIVYEY